MLNDRYKVSGHPTRVLSTVKRKLSAITRDGKIRNFKIGITCHPERRWKQAYKGHYDRMYVLYYSCSPKNIDRMERELINHNWIDRCDNLIGGGGGPKTSIWYYQYLYVVVRKRDI